jgi:NADH:ubiquinone oxidoreductase subunit 3 (subunit A)
MFTILNQAIPLHGGSFSQYCWALLNLMLTILGIMLVFVMLIRLVIRRNRRTGKQADYIEENEDEKQTQKPKSRIIMIALTVLFSVSAILLFLITENIRLQIVLVDWYTIVHVIILAASIITFAFVLRRKNKENEVDEDDAGELQTHTNSSDM